MDTPDILRAAARLVNQTPTITATDAIFRVISGHLPTGAVIPPDHTAAFNQAALAVYRYLNSRYELNALDDDGEHLDFDLIVEDWNAQPGRTAFDVIDVLNHAANQWEREEAHQ